MYENYMSIHYVIHYVLKYVEKWQYFFHKKHYGIRLCQYLYILLRIFTYKLIFIGGKCNLKSVEIIYYYF